MTAKEIRQYLGKRVRFTSDRTRRWIDPISRGVVREVRGRQVYCGGDWHDTKTFVVLETLPDAP